MKRRIVSLLLVACMSVTVFTGCNSKTPANEGGNKEQNNVENENSSDEIVVHEDVKGTVTVGINANRSSDFESLNAAFKKAYPNVEIKPVVFETDEDNALEYLTSQTMAEKTMPDILFDDNVRLPAYIQNGWVYPLNSLLEGDADWEKVPTSIKDPVTYNGNVYALGQSMHFNAVFINTDLVEELNVDLPEYDWTWDDYTDFIKACTNDKYSGVEDMSVAYNWMPGAMTDGCSITGYQEKTNTFNLEAVRKYVNYYLDISKLGSVDAWSLAVKSGSNASWYQKFGEISGNAFDHGKIACILEGTWSEASYNVKNLDFTWEVYPLPQATPGRLPMHVNHCWMTTDVKEENLEAAWAFLRFATYSVEGNMARLTQYDEEHISLDMLYTYYMPVTTDEAVVEKFKSLPFVTDGVIYMYENMDKSYLGDPEKTVPGFEDVEYGIIGKLAYESVTGRDDFSSKMAEAQSKANAEIAKYRKDFETALKKFEKEWAESH